MRIGTKLAEIESIFSLHESQITLKSLSLAVHPLSSEKIYINTFEFDFCSIDISLSSLRDESSGGVCEALVDMTEKNAENYFKYTNHNIIIIEMIVCIIITTIILIIIIIILYL